MAKVVKVGLVGFGLAGEVFHAPMVHAVDGLQLAKVVERHHQKSKEQYPDIEVVKDFSELIYDKSIDLIIIATPNYLHYEMAYEALSAEKHVVIDKPFTITSEEADELIKLAEKKKKVLSAYHNRRFDGDFRTIQKLLKEKQLGSVNYYESHFDRNRPEVKNTWREEEMEGAGILYDLGTHLIDQALVLFGLPLEVEGDVQIQRKGGKADDYFKITLHYKNLKAIVTAGMLVEDNRLHFLIKGDKAVYTKNFMDPQEEALKQGKRPGGDKNWGKEPETNWGVLQIGKTQKSIETLQGDYRLYYQNIYNTIIGKERLKVLPQEARQVIRMIELARESSVQKRPIPFSEAS